ncbi:hypothetical protein ACFYWS_20480 [Streptomyces sp. NPDC002795]|uniref:hypothetical protein n=1 Tax=Streptomyces sp. NPDC002795 TaxID=3364665 RepID=UPI003681A2AA
MTPAVLAWLQSTLGPGTADAADLETRYTRLGSAKQVALEVLSERRARLLADPLRLTVDGVVTLDNSNNLTGLERQIADVQDATAPDQTADDDALPELVVAPLARDDRRCR